jgi:hypothetical protein
LLSSVQIVARIDPRLDLYGQNRQQLSNRNSGERFPLSVRARGA